MIDTADHTRLERRYPAAPERIWELWTTAEGIGSWWAPDGFRTDVNALDLRPGGELVYTMTAVGSGEIAVLRAYGLPLTSVSRKTFTEVVPTSRLAYLSRTDFVAGHEPYEYRTVVDFAPAGGGTSVVVTVHPLHDEARTQHLVDGRGNQLDNLVHLLAD